MPTNIQEEIYMGEIKKNKKKSQIAEVWKRMKKNKTAVFGLTVISFLILAGVFADFIADYDTVVIKQNVSHRLQTPSAAHWFGTDVYGRDIFARIIHGTRTSLTIGVFTSFFAAFIGAIIGAIAGYFGGKIDNLIMRIVDIFMCIPSILLALSVVAALGPGLGNLFIAMVISLTPVFVRLVRAVVLGLREEDYIEAAKASGTTTARIISRHILPNAMGPIIVQATMSVSSTIILAAGLSFLGLGILPPTPEWGAMLAGGKEFMRDAPHIVFFPGMAIVLSALSINLLGDGLRDALDPKLKN